VSKTSQHRRGDGKAALLLVGPAGMLLLGILAIPLVVTIQLSFFDTDITNLNTGGGPFVGLGNYQALLVDQDFWRSLGRLALFAGVTTLVELAIAVVVAIYLDQVVRIPRSLEALLIMPMFVIPVVSGLVFRYMLDPTDGVLAAFCGFFGLTAPGLLADPDWAMAAIMLQDVWRMWPFLFLIVFAGLKALPREPIEAARLDGASIFGVTRFVLLPMLKGTLGVAIVLKLIESLKAFTEIFVMTGGGPADSTELMSLFVVKQAFTFFELSYGAAASIALLLLGAGAAWALAFEQKRQNRASEAC
jgi:multiple sugar transport system permease protein